MPFELFSIAIWLTYDFAWLITSSWISYDHRFFTDIVPFSQVWLTLYHLLMNPEAARKYEFTNYRKTQILKLRKYLNEALLDQLPILVHMQKYLHELSIMETIHAKKDLILEQVPEIRYRIEQSCGGNWLQIAEFQFREYFNPSSKQMQEQAQRLAATYNLDILESLVDEVPKCSKCGKEATKRCSRCRNQWYCSRPCQVQDWTNHKGTCILQEDLAWMGGWSIRTRTR